MAIGRRCTRLPVPRGAAHAALAWTAACSAAVGLTPAESESSKTEPSTTLQTVKERGTLRFVVCGPPNERLPRAGLSEARDRQVAETVAATLGVEAEFIRVADPDRLCQALDEGRGDVVIERHATLAERSADFRRSRPVRLVAEVLIGRKQAGRVRSIEDLSGSTIHVAAGTRLVRTVQEFLSKRGEVDVTLEFVDRPVESMAADVNAGTIDWTVVDSDRLAEFRRYLPEIAPAFEIAAERPVSWVLRSDDEALAAAVDKALAREGVLARPPVIATGDLDEIRKRGELRVLTRNHEISYFVHRGRRFGLDYELMREFA